jgi:ankyrin repeat protein
MCAGNGDARMVKLLMRLGADLNAADVRHNTAVMWAAKSGHRAVLEALISGSAGVDAVNKHGYSAADLAKKAGHSATLELLEKFRDLNVSKNMD